MSDAMTFLQHLTKGELIDYLRLSDAASGAADSCFSLYDRAQEHGAGLP